MVRLLFFSHIFEILNKNHIFFSGKSTLAALLLRLYDPDRGQIIIDNHDIKLLDLSWLRKQIGTVTQEPILFSSTIRDNISYGADNPEAQCSKNGKIVQYNNRKNQLF